MCGLNLFHYGQKGVAKRERQKSNLKVTNTMRPEMITQIIQKQFFCVTDVRAFGK